MTEMKIWNAGEVFGSAREVLGNVCEVLSLDKVGLGKVDRLSQATEQFFDLCPSELLPAGFSCARFDQP